MRQGGSTKVTMMSTLFCQGLEAPPTHAKPLSNETKIADPSFDLLSFFHLPHQKPTLIPLPIPNTTAKMVAQTAEFKKAVEDSRKLKAKPSDDELLQVREQWPRVQGRHTRLTMVV